MPAYPHFVDGNYRPESITADCEETINFFYAKIQAAGGKAAAALYSTPGVRLNNTVANGPGRGAVAIGGGRTFFVSGTGLYEWFQNKTSVLRSTMAMAIDGNPATLTPNGEGGNQLLVTSGDRAYLLDLVTLAFTQVLAVGATTGGYMSGYFVVFDRTNSLIQLSDLFDGTVWDPTQFAQNTMSPDPWRQMVVNGYSEAWLFGEFTSQVWIDTGASPFPLAPRQGLLIPYGIAASFSAISFESVMLWIANSPQGSGIVMEASGYSPSPISDDAITTELQSYQRIDDAEAWAYQMFGHLFYVISFPSADVTWVYDRTEGKWHKWLTWDSVLGAYHRARAHWHLHEWNTHFVLDNNGGGIYELSTKYGLDVDEMPIRRLRAAPALYDEGNLIPYTNFVLLMDTGLGTTSGQGFDPSVLMETSDDGGRSYSNGRARSAGKTGEFTKILRWNRCGSARDRAFRIIYSDPPPCRIVNAFLNVQGGGAESAAA